ncbi:MAG: hypothetical protein A2X61_02155 [Ignavibacteria bacterium GWB2_35_12]|nr:MAG: hypothetical protein A2X63_09130 [Ignavibacteria bacterium GWA2_35_8]OGU38688.1 MAG: hypothetical protein A2X61_02155 [Ignavibacteria bacterium GWB2_35_12]OGU88819.1 MAG: hypothetical protein A2220_16770 [Ignavibacteria bacterium RIFOXYA2_FULL_35_10]OGV20894.1 MAG: hypothetical protein A2475_02030 [Ignavibacteria bacterium RIFOXYC2_FULL_35_21]
MKVLFLLLFIVLLFQPLPAQNYEFCVLGKVGTALVQFNGNKDWSELKTGDQLKRNDVISLKDNSYIGLVHSTGKTIELRQSGEYKISKLAVDLLENTTSMLPNLIEVIFGKKSDIKDILESKQSKKVFSKGAIERSIEIEQITILSPKKIILISDDVTLFWSKFPSEGKYEIKISDRFNKLIFSRAVDDTTISLNQKELKLDGDQYYFWRVNLLTNPEIMSDEGYFLFLSDKRIAEIKKNVEQMKKDIGGKETSVSKIILAFYYENNLLVNEADKEFREAIDLSPDVADYKDLYDAFKMRMNIRR